LRREHRSRFVHDQKTRVLQQTPHDFDALPLTHRQAVHMALRVDIESVIRRHFADAPRQRLQVERFVERKRDVLAHRQRLEQREMLEHHADTELARGRGTRDLHGLPLPADLTGVRAHRTVDDLHQRAFARAVFAEYRVNLAGCDDQRHIVVGPHGRILLGDARQHEARHSSRDRRAARRLRGGGAVMKRSIAHEFP
jgi:hypothetical protein